jgi:hypothetical protein
MRQRILTTLPALASCLQWLISKSELSSPS